MLLECVNELDEEQITSEELFCELFSIEDAFVHEQKRQEAEKRATEVKKKSEFSRLYRSYKAEMKKSELTVADKPSKRQNACLLSSHIPETNLDKRRNQHMQSGIAGEDSGQMEIRVCGQANGRK